MNGMLKWESEDQWDCQDTKREMDGAGKNEKERSYISHGIFHEIPVAQQTTHLRIDTQF